jgi:hypothetical protein
MDEMVKRVVHIGAMINVYNILVGESEWKRLHGRKM